MMHIKNVTSGRGESVDLFLPSPQDLSLDGSGLTALPALIDPHVHFRIPGGAHKEDWKSGALAALAGGVTTVFDMPNNTPACVTLDLLRAKKAQIDGELRAVGLPLHYGLYLGADKNHLEEIEKVHGEAVGVKVFMGCSTGNLVIDTDEALCEVFERARRADLLVAVHAEDEELLSARKKAFGKVTDPACHSQIRSREVAIRATTKAIELAARYGNRLYILHLSTKEELELIRAAKRSGVKVYAEATPHHLFLTVHDYAKWGCFVQMNPPLRDPEDREALWEALCDGTIDTIGTDHAPHTRQEKSLPYGEAPSGIPGVETSLPLMLDAVAHGKLTLERLVELTSKRATQMFDLIPNGDLVLVDLNCQRELLESDLKTKCGWSPYVGKSLRGWPVYTILGGRLFPANLKIAAERERVAPYQRGES